MSHASRRRRRYVSILLLSVGSIAGLAIAANGTASRPTVKVKKKPADAAWTDRPVTTVASLPNFKPGEAKLDAFGGLADVKRKATGFFRAEKVGNRWWLVDPDGGQFLSVGVNSVAPGATSKQKAVIAEKFPSLPAWAEAETARLRSFGFNTAGNWSDVKLLGPLKDPLAFTSDGPSAAPGSTRRGGFLRAFASPRGLAKAGTGHATYPGDCMPVFHPEFEAFCDEFAKPVAGLKNDKHLLGYFSDNELPQPKLENYLKLDPADAGMGSSRKAAQAWLDARKGKPSTVADATDADREAWTEFVYDRYFSLTTKALRKYDPNHLCLGSRLYGGEKRVPGVFRAAGRHLDVIAINHYGTWEPVPADLARWTEWSGKPVMITEWYAKGADSGMPNTGGAGWLVPTQLDRGLFYQTFTLGLLRSPNCVGWHWFKYQDNDPTDKSADPSNQDSNKGVVDGKFDAYAPLVEKMTELNRNVYGLVRYVDGK